MAILDVLFFGLVLIIVFVSYLYGKANAQVNLAEFQKLTISETILWLAKNDFMRYTVDEHGQYIFTPLEDIPDASQEKPDSKEES